MDWDFGSWILGFGFWIWANLVSIFFGAFGFQVSDLRLDFGFRILDLRLWVSDSRFWMGYFGISGFGLGCGWDILGFWIGISDFGFWIWDWILGGYFGI